MEKKPIPASKIAGLAGNVVKLLESLSPMDRQKVIHGALAMLGDTPMEAAPRVPARRRAKAPAGRKPMSTLVYQRKAKHGRHKTESPWINWSAYLRSQPMA
jgi:hypothetical protein